jgi:hypothetical protein
MGLLRAVASALICGCAGAALRGGLPEDNAPFLKNGVARRLLNITGECAVRAGMMVVEPRDPRWEGWIC